MQIVSQLKKKKQIALRKLISSLVSDHLLVHKNVEKFAMIFDIYNPTTINTKKIFFLT